MRGYFRTPIGLYLRPASTGTNGRSSPAGIPSWEVCRQEIRSTGHGSEIELVVQVLATGLTLCAAWSALTALGAALAATIPDQVCGGECPTLNKEQYR
jgi:hypothetical protein